MKICALSVALFLVLQWCTLRPVVAEAGEPTGRSDPIGTAPPAQDAIRCPIVPEQDEGMITALGFSPNGKAIVAGNTHGVVKLFDPATGNVLSRFRALSPVEGCATLAFAPDGRTLAVQTKKLGHVALVEPTNGRIIREMQFIPKAERGGYKALSFSSDGKRLAGGLGSGEVLVWDATDGRLLRSFPPQIVPEQTYGPFHKKVLATPAPVGSLSFSADGNTLRVAAYNLEAWDVLAGQRRPYLWPADAHAYQLAASPDGATFAVVGSFPLPDGGMSRLAVVDAATSRMRAFPEALAVPTDPGMWDVAFLPDGKRFLTIGHYRVLQLWDVATARLLATKRFDEHFSLSSLVVSPDGRRVAAGGYESNWIFGAIAMAEVEGDAFKPWRPAP